jgi:hypothetical protein
MMMGDEDGGQVPKHKYNQPEGRCQQISGAVVPLGVALVVLSSRHFRDTL